VVVVALVAGRLDQQYSFEAVAAKNQFAACQVVAAVEDVDLVAVSTMSLQVAVGCLMADAAVVAAAVAVPAGTVVAAVSVVPVETVRSRLVAFEVQQRQNRLVADVATMIQVALAIVFLVLFRRLVAANPIQSAAFELDSEVDLDHCLVFRH
jgi:hypothetical protein